MLPAPCSLFRVLSAFRKKLCCGGDDWRGHWMRYFVFILHKLLFLTRNMFLCPCPSALSITMLSFAGWLSKDMYITIIVKRSQAPTQLALLLLPVSREQFKVCTNSFEWHPATVLFVYSVLLSLPGQPPCLHLGFCRDSVAVSAADLLLRGFQCADACGKRGYSDYFSFSFCSYHFSHWPTTFDHDQWFPAPYLWADKSSQFETTVAAQWTVLVFLEMMIRDG